ncbi:hypothetical protein [Rhodopseudomonas sp. BR0G17]|uniref:hypothetical protein n=1 Tax=Rhodopseudomonas sp. BR0G17 TaxID=2269368 RepID=UPI0013DF7923|nr:hypothetical protein [Rhodopseudomonas sp. BR0G17]NEW96632.1 hypothetical protein [Rhodopseudomonas sp. BR0G17]
MDEPRLDLDAGLWLSISEIARQKGKSRQAVAKRVAGLVEAGQLETKAGADGTKLVNLAQYDRAVGDTGDAVKEAAAQTRSEADAAAPGDASPVLRDHQARAAQYTADLKYLDLEERLGRLVPLADVADGANRAAEAIVRVIDRLPSHAETVAGAVGKDGPAGARAALKEIAREIRAAIAEAMGILAGSAAPLTIEPGEDHDAPV